jgi:ATP synthase protein I
MTSSNEDKRESDTRGQMLVDIEGKQARKLRARGHQDRGMWFGLGMMGTIGWSVAVPTLVGLAVGVWIDSRWPTSVSWTLILLVGGLLLGCVNAWLWIAREQRTMEREKEDRSSD